MQPVGIEEVDIAAIRMPERLRRVDEAWVEALAQSIARNGLQQPVQLARDAGGGLRLVAGAHRLAALQRLGRETVAALIVEASEDEARLLEIDENLFRRELSAFDRAKFLAERQAIWERLHPETRRGVAGGKARQGSATENISFAASAAERTGLTERSIRLAIKLWRDLSPEARALIDGTELAENGALLRRIGALPPHRQVHLVRERLAGPARGIGGPADTVQAQYERLVKAWGRAGQLARAMFRRHIEGEQQDEA